MNGSSLAGTTSRTSGLAKCWGRKEHKLIEDVGCQGTVGASLSQKSAGEIEAKEKRKQ